MNENPKSRNRQRLSQENFTKTCTDLAIYLLGKILVRKLRDGCILKGRIVETECYPGGEDMASHSFKGKITKRNEPMYLTPGTAYVYTLYYGYHCFNISSKEPGAVVLVRALEPVFGEDMMRVLRDRHKKNTKLKILKMSKLCDGPAKLCMSLNITKENSNKLDLSDPMNEYLWIEEDLEKTQEFSVVNSTRIGLGKSAEDSANALLRYYIFKNESVSKTDKEAERNMFYFKQ